MANEVAQASEATVKGGRAFLPSRFARWREEGRIGMILWPTLSTVAFLAIWQFLSVSGIVDELLLPSFTDTIAALGDLVNTYYFWEATWVTTQESVYGFAIGVAAAFILGTLIGLFRWVSLALYPLIVAIEIVPRVALAPVFLAWFGFGLTSKILMAAAICFFPVLINVILGLEGVSKDARALMRSLGASRWEEYRKLLLPSSLPAIFASLKIAITFALTGAIVAEFVGGTEGMGNLIKIFNFQLLIPEGFAVIIALSLLGVILYGITMILESRIVFWRGH
jgi:NitT/TauT family transport system permease protein